MNLFSKAEVGMALREFARKVGIPNEMHFDREDEQMGPHSNFQCAIRRINYRMDKFRTLLTLSESRWEFD